MNGMRLHIARLTCLMAAGLPLNHLQGQQALAPWVGGMPGLEHPAAWALQDAPFSFGLQHATRRTGTEDPFTDQWFCVGWAPSRQGTGWNASPLDNWALGTAHGSVQAGHGWRESRHSIHSAVRVPLDQGWTGSAGLGIGVRTWILDGRSWSWDTQYGPGGYNPNSPTGEPDGVVAGAGVEPEISLGVAAERQPRSGQGPALRGAASLHHVLPMSSPSFQPSMGDTIRRSVSGWFEIEDDLGYRRLRWKAWWRGALQGPSHVIEFGSSVGWTFGDASRHTRNSLGHHLSIGTLWRSDGQFRIPFSWQHGEIRVWTGPGLDAGHTSPMSAGWALGALWIPRFTDSTPIGSN